MASKPSPEPCEGIMASKPSPGNAFLTTFITIAMFLKSKCLNFRSPGLLLREEEEQEFLNLDKTTQNSE